MAVQVEPPRWRPRSSEPARYPGLTPEERGYEPTTPVATPPEPLPETPLWIAPSEMPPPDRAVGFVVVSRAPPEPAPTPPEAEGLFDVPGLLERLWLARALEGRRDLAVSRAAMLPPPGSSSDMLPPALTPEPRTDPAATLREPPARELAPAAAAPPVERLRDLSAPSPPASWPSSWVCPYCYLANDPRAATCRGCRSSSLHL